MARDEGLDTLLDLDGYIADQGDGYWIKVDAVIVEVTAGRPHGIKYSLSLHAPNGERILGYDNAHAPSKKRNEKYVGQKRPFDHKHRTVSDKGIKYVFTTPYQLLEDFFNDVDKVLKAYCDN